MPLNKTKGNMYSFITHTWNPIKHLGACPHGCSYCFKRKWGKKQTPPRLDESEFKVDLGSGNYHFVVSGSDMWGDWIPENWISRILAYNRLFPENTYLYQTKNPGRFHYYQSQFPEKTILCTTVESNYYYRSLYNMDITDCRDRMYHISILKLQGFKTMITVEPILKFINPAFQRQIIDCNPDYINIGADSQGHGLPEPEPRKVRDLIAALRDAGYNVHLKPNLNRLLNGKCIKTP